MRAILKESALGEGVLRGLYNGHIIPWERRCPPDDRQREILGKLEEEDRYFMAKMSPNDCKRFEALSRLHSELSIISEEHLFAYAFTLGLLLAMDVVKETETVTTASPRAERFRTTPRRYK